MSDLESLRADAVMLTDVKHEEEKMSSHKIGYDYIGGLQKQVTQIKEIVEGSLEHPQLLRSILFYGASGTGKTLTARAVANETGAFFVFINGSEMMSKEAGQRESDLRQAFEDAQKKSSCILFIKKLDSIAAKGQVEQGLLSQLLRFIDNLEKSSHLIVIGSTNQLNSIDPNLRRHGRFDRQIYFGIPNTVARLEILRIHTKNSSLADDVDLMEIADMTDGYVGADLASLCSEAVSHAISNSKEDQADHLVVVSQDSFRFSLNQTYPTVLREKPFEIPRITWTDIAGLENIKCQSQQLPDEPFLKLGSSTSRAIILHGPPGCGKTLLAKAIANECLANFIWVTASDFWTMQCSEAEDSVFDRACQATPCVLFFDAVHSITSLQKDIKDKILTNIDRMHTIDNVFLIGETNRPDMIDSSLFQPGRFDRLIYLPLPDEKSRFDIIKLVLRKSPVDKDLNIQSLAERTNGFSGADVTEICQRAAKSAIRQSIENDDLEIQIGPQHFAEAMKYARRSVSEKDMAQYQAFAQTHQGRAFHSQSHVSDQGGEKLPDECKTLFLNDYRK